MKKLAIFALLAMTAPALAQSVAIEHYIAAPIGRDGFVLSRPVSLGHLRPTASLHLDYGALPLVLQTQSGDSPKLVENLFAGQLGLGLGLFDRFVIFTRLPVHFVLDGQVVPGFPSGSGAGLGDVVLGARVRLYGEARDPVAVAVEVEAGLPTARAANSSSTLAGEAAVTFAPRVVAEVRPHNLVRINAVLGGRFRETATFQELAVGHELTFGLGGGVWILEDALEARIEFFGSTSFSRFGNDQLTPMEILGGARWTPIEGLTIGLALGPGLGRGYGTPIFRGALSVSWTGPALDPQNTRDSMEEPDEPADVHVDPAGASIASAPSAGAPTAREATVDPYAAPAASADAAIPGAPPIPPLTIPPAPESPSPVPGARRPALAAGYSEIDRDGDNIADAQDHCPLDREDFDEILDADGCPEADADGDRLADADDHCPLTQGAQTDPGCAGCPERACMSGTGGAIDIRERVEFEAGSDVIASGSEAVLRDVVAIMQGNLQIRRVRVEGHTDSSGVDAANLDLSRRRAASVRRYIVEHQVAAERIEAWGCGEQHPLEPNTTPTGRRANRRVEFLITDPPTAQAVRQGCVSAE